MSTTIKIGEAKEGIAINEAPKIAAYCGANVIIWGKYSNSSDSLRLILQYHFLEKPDSSKTGDLLVLPDVTSIHSGKMFKNLEDSIMSLCSIIALRQNNIELSKKWVDKVNKKDEIDLEIIDILRKIPDDDTGG